MRNIEEIIKERSSIRDYEKKELDEEIIKKVMEYCNEINEIDGPFGTRINIQLLRAKELDSNIKLGTYGMIKGASNYLIVTINEENNNLFDLGYLFEKVILYLTEIGLGSVWMAGTYDKKQFNSVVNIPSGEKLIIVTPFGKEAKKKSLLGKVLSGKSKSRKEFDKLFSNIDLTEIDREKNFVSALEMVRLAPSALNKQPWKILVDENEKKYHFYCTFEREGIDINMGIALLHFEVMMNEIGITGKVIIEENDYYPAYCFTWKEDK